MSWISVKDKLPEREVNVLIFEPSHVENFTEGTMAVSYWTGEYHHDKIKGKKVSYPLFPDGQDEQPSYYWPSHWMELPKPPTELGGNQTTKA